jgi:hypothetical protein
MRHGAKFGREMVSAISDPHPGMIISDTKRADGPNQWVSLAAESRAIEGVVIKASADNTGTIYVTGAEGNIDGFPLAAGETLSIMTDDLTKVAVWIPTTADGFSWIAIEQARV